MLVRTDDEVYRVDAVWLGPPRATFPWRARYVSYGVGLLMMLFIMFLQRRLGIGLDFFSVAWSLVGTVAITRFLGKKIDYERPLGQVVSQFWAEVTGPRARSRAAGGSVRAGHVRVRAAGGRGRGTAASRPSSPAQVGAPSGSGSVTEVWAGSGSTGGSGAPKASPVRVGSRTPVAPAGGSRPSAPSRAERKAAKKDARTTEKAAGKATTTSTKKSGTAPSPRPGAGRPVEWEKTARTTTVADAWQKAGSRGRR